jgi:methionine-rich copper-binding protein CopC
VKILKLRLLISLFVAIIFAFLPHGEVLAHTELESTLPADGSKLVEPVNEISVSFSHKIQPFSKLSVSDPTGNQIKLEQVTVDAKTMSATIVPALDNGSYTVHWQVASDDGHTSDGLFSFTVEASVSNSKGVVAETIEPSAIVPTIEEAATVEPIVKDKASENQSSLKQYAPVVAIVLVIILAILAFFMLKSKRNGNEVR